MISIERPYVVVPDVDGQPVDDGYVYIGAAGLNAESNPVSVYWDSALTVPAAQPIRTINGFFSQNGSPGMLYTASDDYSMLVRNKNSSLIYSALSAAKKDTNTVRTYDNVAAMKLASPAVGQMLATKGYYTAGDKGEATYLVVSPTAVNGYTDHVLANGNVALLQCVDGLSIRQAGASDTKTDNTAEIQAAMDYWTVLFGGLVTVPPGDYKCANLIARQSVTVDSGMRGLTRSAISQRPPRFLLNDNGAIITTPDAVDNFAFLGIVFSGANVTTGTARGVVLGADIAIFGDASDITIRKANFSYCSFVQFRQEGLLAKNTVGLFQSYNFSENCLKDLTYLTEQRAAVAVYGNDSMTSFCEFTAQNQGAATSANLFRAGFGYFGGTSRANSFISDCIGETSDIGFVFSQRLVRAVNCRADRNYGHGFKVTESGVQGTNCTAYDNSLDTTNTYDGFYVDANRCAFTNCQAWSATNAHRYGFNDVRNETVLGWKNTYNGGCRSSGHGTAAFASVTAAIQTPFGIEALIADGDTTPSVDQWGTFRTNNAGATSITDFDDGFNGQRITVRCTTANTTFVNGATLSTTTGGNITAAAGKVAEFYRYNGVWYLMNNASIV